MATEKGKVKIKLGAKSELTTYTREQVIGLLIKQRKLCADAIDVQMTAFTAKRKILETKIVL